MFLTVSQGEVRSVSCEEEAIGGIIPASPAGAAFVVISQNGLSDDINEHYNKNDANTQSYPS
ncbi:hypothetical protein D3C74_452510 [compost metagenome]